MWKETLLGCNKKSPIGGGETWSHIGLLENIERNEKKVKVLKVQVLGIWHHKYPNSSLSDKGGNN